MRSDWGGGEDAEHLGRAGLVITQRAAALGGVVAHRLEQPERAERHHVGGVFRHLERDFDVALRAEIVDLVRLDRLEHAAQRRAVGKIAVMEGELFARDVGIVIEMVDAVGVEQTRPPHQAVHLIALLQQEFAQIGAVLAGDAGNQCAFCHVTSQYPPPRAMLRHRSRGRERERLGPGNGAEISGDGTRALGPVGRPEAHCTRPLRRT